MSEKRKINRRTILPSKIIKKVISKASTAKVEKEKEAIEQPKEVRVKKECLFCQNTKSPSYTDIATLKRFLTDRSKIFPKLRSGVCSKHQRAVAKNIKYARHLALLPFVPKVP